MPLVVVLLLTGCGPPDALLPGAPPDTPVPVPVNGITEMDNGKEFGVQLGETITVSLHQAPGFEPWADPSVGDINVLKAAGASSAMAGVSERTFRAVGQGRVVITSTARPACPALEGCSAHAQLFRVVVTVV